VHAVEEYTNAFAKEIQMIQLIIGLVLGIALSYLYRSFSRFIKLYKIERQDAHIKDLKVQAKKDILDYIELRGGQNFIDKCWNQKWIASQLDNSGIQLPPLDWSNFDGK